MFATPHTLAGFAIIKTFEDNLALGVPLAIASHFILDFIDEGGLTAKDRIYFDLCPNLICYFLALLTGHTWLFIIGSVSGNLLDLIDKKLYLAIFYPRKFTATKYFHFQKQLLFPSPTLTKVIGWSSLIIIIMLFIG